MSGSTGADRIKSRADFDQFVKSYTKIISKFPGFVSITPSGSYNSDKNKKDFGDIDLITHIESDKSKAEVKKDMVKFFEAMPHDIIKPFSSEKHAGKRTGNTGELVTIRYHDAKLGYSVQVDNMIALSHAEANFKQQFLDYPAEKQGLILGLIKVATIEQPLAPLFKKLGIKVPVKLPKDEEYEFNLSGVELQLRHSIYEPGTFKQKSRSIVWHTSDFDDVEIVLSQYNLGDTFDGLVKQAKNNLKNPRSNIRMQGVFRSMISVKSGEVGTPKGNAKEEARQKVSAIFGESIKLISFKEYVSINITEEF